MTEAEIQSLRVKAVALAMCAADDKAYFGDPKTRAARSVSYEAQAERFIAAFQSLHEFEFRRAHGKPGPYAQKALTQGDK